MLHIASIHMSTGNFYFSFIHMPIDPVSSPVVLNEVTPNTNNSQAPPVPEADASGFQGNSSEQTPKIEANQNYILTKCPAYQTCQLQHKHQNQGRMAL